MLIPLSNSTSGPPNISILLATPKTQMLTSLKAAGVKDPQLAATMAAYNATTANGKGHVFPSSAVPPEAMVGMLNNATALLDRNIHLALLPAVNKQG